jgi:putative heme-binding domain-containing protein
VRLLTDFWPIDTVHGLVRSKPELIEPELVARLASMAKDDPSGLVRLVFGSTIRRLPLESRPILAAALLSHDEDADDHNLPKLLWYGLAPLLEKNAELLVPLAAHSRLPLTREWIVRALAEDASKNAQVLGELLRRTTDQEEDVRADVVRGLVAGLAGRRKAEPLDGWTEFEASLATAAPDVCDLVRKLNIVFGDGRALEEVRRLALDGSSPISERRLALEAFIEAKPDDLREVCEKLLRVRFLNLTALRGLTLFDDESIGDQLAKSYNSFHPSERAAVIETLVSRPSFARGLLDQVEAGKIPVSEISAVQARQIRSFGNEALSVRLSDVWGELRDSPQDKQELINRLKQQLTGQRMTAADPRQGRVVYQKTCANCHRMYGSGGTIGPDLTGSGRQNLDYLLLNVVDPSALVNKDYRMSVVRHRDGRVLNGIVISQDAERIVLQTVQERLTILREEIEDIALTTLSPMPEGILQPLQDEQIRDLVAYLMGAGQVALPTDAK